MTDSNGDDDAFAVFLPSGRRGRFAKGTSLLAAARHLGVDLDSVCGGRAICGRCQVAVCEGSYPKLGVESSAAHVSGVEEPEQRYARLRDLPAGRRLGCSARILGDVVVDVPASSQVHKQMVRKGAEVRAIDIDPILKLHYAEVAEPEIDHPAGDAQRLITALREQWGLAVERVELCVLSHLQRTLRAGEWKVSALVRNETEVVAVWPGFHDRIFGVAVDVGSTTLACHLCDLESGEVLAAAGAMNPQIRFGEDLMSRVSTAIMTEGSVAEMAAAVRQAINGLIAETAESAGIAVTDVVDATFVGNPIMIHLLLGLDPSELGFAPFALASDAAQTVRASDLDLAINPGARPYILPLIAGHVGADTAAAILSETPHHEGELMLLVDVGTNAEIVVGNRYRLLAASSPTGPAFEGAQVSSGQRASPGAIERVRIDPDTLEPRFKVIGSELWSNEPGFAEVAADLGVTGICGSGIIEAIAEMYLAGVLGGDGLIDGAQAERSPRVVRDGEATFAYRLWDGPPAIAITQRDVRAIQLAKAALYTGIRLLLARLGDRTLERIVLAGAFGSHIDPKYAMILGLIPDCPVDKVSAAGNAAGTGARIALLNRQSRREIEELVRRIEKIETATEPAFQAYFVEAMAIPHKSDPFPNLARAVKLPASAPVTPVSAQSVTVGVQSVWGRQRRRSGTG